MGWQAEAYRQEWLPEGTRRAERSERVFDILCANNSPARLCIDAECKNTNWGGYCRLHLRFSDCPTFRLNGGWF